MTWVATTAPGADRITFRGEAPGNVGSVFRGTISVEMWRAFRSMTVGSMRRGVRGGWRIEVPDHYLSYPNTGEKRRFVVFHSPTVRTPLVLRFDRAVQESLLRDITQAFTPSANNEEVSDGQEHSGQRTEADREVEPHSGSASEPQPGRDRRGRPSAQDPGRDAEGQQVAGTWWKKKKAKKKHRSSGS